MSFSDRLDAQSVCKHIVTLSTSEPEFQQHHNKTQVISCHPHQAQGDR